MLLRANQLTTRFCVIAIAVTAGTHPIGAVFAGPDVDSRRPAPVVFRRNLVRSRTPYRMRTAPLQLALLVLLFGIAAPTYADSYESFTEPNRNLALAPAEPGLLVELNVREGDVVQAGQSLAALDRETLVIAREIAETTLKGEGKSRAARAECTLRRERLDKLRKLRAQGHAGADEVARAEADLEIAEGQRLTLEEQRALDWNCARSKP